MPDIFKNRAMKIVIAGAGEVGTHLAKMLSRQDHSIMLIDSDHEKLEQLESQLDILAEEASCTSIGALEDAGVRDCDLFIAVNHQEDLNINSSILAKHLGAKYTITRVNNSEYLEDANREYMRTVGIDSMIYPERLAAEEIVSALKLAGTRQQHEFSDGRLQLLAIKIWENAPVLNLTLAKTAQAYGTDNFRVVAIKRGDQTVIPRGNDYFRYGDLAFFVTKPMYIPEIYSICGKSRFEIKNIIIVGGSRIGFKAASLLEQHYNVKLADGTEIEFDSDGVWKEISAKTSAVPNPIIPEAILNYIRDNFKSSPVIQIEKKEYGYKIELATKQELKFSKQFVFLGLD